MRKPVLIIINGLPGAGKTTLAKRLAADLQLPVFSRDGLYETLYDALEYTNNNAPPLLGSTAFKLLYSITGTILAAGQALVVEGFFGRPELRGAEFLELQRAHDFEPFQIVCRTDGTLLLQRFMDRVESVDRHSSHSDLEWLEENKERLLQGQLIPMDLGGQLVEIDNTTPQSFDYADLLQQVRTALVHTEAH
ncbi:hypothetical protein KDA_64210 [Dictyobacter alpinus]|uniref:ATP-binding protein n=1 Tax=Dictyobacter alpinus TaxID=2014873 RepID=A0A402BI61_9CHLR|nr:AAA family ATPase [Dictyobacter alpinus]GCE30937.1 hypothetical protein KDA_64210 [Dictyobacter alpinus]